MAKARWLSVSHMDGGTLTASSEAIAVSNIQDTSVKRAWRSTDTTDQWIKNNYGSSKDHNGIHLENVNASDDAWYVIQLSEDDFATVKYAEPFQKWSRDLTYKSATLWLSGESGGDYVEDANGDWVLDANDDFVIDTAYSETLPIAAQYVRLIIVDPDNTDGYMEIGRAKVGEYFNAPSSLNIGVGPRLSYRERAPLMGTRGGGFRAEQIDPQRVVRVQYEMVHEDDAVAADAFADILRVTGHRDDIVFSAYPDEDNDRERLHTVLGRITNNPQIQGVFNVNSSGSLVLYSSLTIEITEAL